eukprot:scaffold14974_cov195-Amphora_coffeaeformis.AAC.41
MAPKTGYLLHDDVAADNRSLYTAGSSGTIDAAALAKAHANTSSLDSHISKYAYADKGGRMPDTQPFIAAFEEELHRVLRVVDYYQNDLEFTAKALLTSAEVAVEQVSTSQDGHKMVHELAQKMDDLVDGCLELQNFVTKNRWALLNVAQKADEQLKTQCALRVFNSLKSNLNSVLVIVASDIYTAIRTAEKKLNDKTAGEEDGVWKAPSSFQRSTTKYWVKEEQLTNLMLTCAGEAPLLVYGKKGTLTSKSDRLTRKSEGDKLWDSMVTPITSVYFDAADMSMYKKRLARMEGAELLRARWYGTKMPKGDGIIYLELKTHHEKWVANKSVKERAAVQEKDMRFFLQPVPWSAKEAQEMILRASPTLTGEELTKAANLLYRMHKLVIKYNLRACVRSVYMRAAFQSAKSNDLRLTLDRNVTLVDETVRNTSLSKSWCLTDDEAKKSARAVVVPFNVFEVKLVGDNPMPQGLATLISTGVIEDAPKFSKFLTGAAAFNRVSTLPYWASNPAFAATFGMTKSSQSENDPYEYTSLTDPCDCYHLFGGDSTSGVRKRNPIARFLNPSSGESTDRGDVKIAQKKPVKVEPKSFFANERTFIQWISAALLLLTVASIMMSNENGDYGHTAALISASALGLVVYATFVYFRRIKLLKSGKGYGYIDHVGPIILAAGVGIGVFIVFWDIIGSVDILGQSKHEQNRRMFSLSPRRLFASSAETNDAVKSAGAAMYEDPEHCFQLPIAGVNSLTYEPNDAILGLDKASLLVASTMEILSHPLQGGDALHLAHLQNTELGGLTAIGNRIFALSGGPEETELFEFAWTKYGDLEKQGSWIVAESASEINGLAFVADVEEGEGQLLLGMDGSIHSYQVPYREDTSLIRVQNINMKLIHQGLGQHDKITSIHHFEGVTYVLHSTSRLLRAWDMMTGEFLAETQLPRLDNALSDQWKGLTLQRRPIKQEEGSLRGSKNLSELWMHLTLDAPPQIWTFAIEESDSRGRLVLPECASVSFSATNQ